MRCLAQRMYLVCGRTIYTMSKLGIIQSRGLGDLLIALPIANYYRKQGHEILWPVCEQFYPSVRDTVPWVKWIPIVVDGKSDFFYQEPIKRLKAFGCTEWICLYQSLNTVPELCEVPYFQIQHFDEFKYSKAGVPFLDKWTLADCITRDPVREQKLFDLLVKQEKYFVTHTEGSTFKVDPDLSGIPTDWQHISITEGITDCIFDWLKIIENAQAIICLDSVVSNMVDQLKIDVDRYWIPRSHIHQTPVLGMDWTILECPEGSLAAQQIFAPSR